ENLFRLLNRDCFHQIHISESCVVDQHVQPPGLADHSIYARIHRRFIGHIHFHHFNRQGILRRKPAQASCSLGVLSVHAAHRGKHGIAVSRKFFGEQPAESRARSRNQHNWFTRAHKIAPFRYGSSKLLIVAWRAFVASAAPGLIINAVCIPASFAASNSASTSETKSTLPLFSLSAPAIAE